MLHEKNEDSAESGSAGFVAEVRVRGISAKENAGAETDQRGRLRRHTGGARMMMASAGTGGRQMVQGLPIRAGGQAFRRLFQHRGLEIANFVFAGPVSAGQHGHRDQGSENQDERPWESCFHLAKLV